MSCSKCLNKTLNMNSKILDIKMLNIKDLNSLPLNSLIELYRNGYKLSEHFSSIKSLATCLTTVKQGNIYQMKLEPGGVPPYQIQVSVDGLIKKVWSGQTGIVTLAYKFDEPIGSHIVEAKMTDSCLSPQTITDSCNVMVEPNISPPPSSNKDTLIIAGIALILISL